MHASLPGSVRHSGAVRPEWIGLALSLLLLTGACEQRRSSVRSYLEGRVVVDSSVTRSEDYSDFRLLVMHAHGRQLDTLGHARTDRDGRFRMEVAAPERGVYPLTLWGREGRRQLAGTDYVVADGDSGTLHAELPPTRRPPLRPESPENLALLGYRNTMTMHRRMLTRRLQADAYRPNALVQNVRLTSSTLWSLRDQYPGTFAGQFAAVESLSLLEGWNDSLVVARARRIPSTSPRFLDALRIARRAEARLRGHRAALALVDSFQAQPLSSNQVAGVKAVRIQAFLDSLQFQAAFSAARQLKAEHPNTTWAKWARGVRREAHHLRPGMTAPDLTLRTLQDDTLSLRDLRGRPVVLEYYRPGTDLYNLQRPLRNALYRATRPDSVAFVSISVEPDTLVNRAFLHNQRLPGHTAIAPRGPKDSLATRYNVVHVPTWFLLNADGTIVDQYWASDFPTLRRHLTQLLHRDSVAVPLTPTHSPPKFPGSFTKQARAPLETSCADRVIARHGVLGGPVRRSSRNPPHRPCRPHSPVLSPTSKTSSRIRTWPPSPRPRPSWFAASASGLTSARIR